MKKNLENNSENRQWKAVIRFPKSWTWAKWSYANFLSSYTNLKRLYSCFEYKVWISINFLTMSPGITPSEIWSRCCKELKFQILNWKKKFIFWRIHYRSQKLFVNLIFFSEKYFQRLFPLFSIVTLVTLPLTMLKIICCDRAYNHYVLFLFCLPEEKYKSIMVLYVKEN